MKTHSVRTRVSAAAVLIGGASAVLACAPASSSRDAGTRQIAAARRELDKHMAQCTKAYGYNIESAAKLPQNVLGPGERDGGAAFMKELRSI
jgi:NADP-dependent 3-hydroxy acid dehydrogenase YdfG